MTKESIEAMRVITSVAASEQLDAHIKERAKAILQEYMNVIEKEVALEMRSVTEFSAQISGIVTS